MAISGRFLAIGVCLVFVLTLYGCGGGGGEPAPAKPKSAGAKPAVTQEVKPLPKPGVPVAKPELGDAETAEEKAKQRALAKEKLNDTEWDVNVTQEGSNEQLKDTIKFENKKVYSIDYKKKGYMPSNYSVRVRGDDTISWETMQTKEGEGVLFWRGDWKGDVMRGSLTKHPDQGENENFSFVSTVSRRLGGAEPEKQVKKPEKK